MALVAAVVAVGAAFAIISNSGEGDDKNIPTDTLCWVYGNANMDNVVDEKDIDYLQDIIDGKKLADPKWTKVAGVSPRDFNFAGNYIFCANEKSAVTVFKASGKELEKLGIELEMPGALCVAVL